MLQILNNQLVKKTGMLIHLEKNPGCNTCKIKIKIKMTITFKKRKWWVGKKKKIKYKIVSIKVTINKTNNHTKIIHIVTGNNNKMHNINNSNKNKRNKGINFLPFYRTKELL